ncbi:unnamed protein product, partial [marine sediment metagenome]
NVILRLNSTLTNNNQNTEIVEVGEDKEVELIIKEHISMIQECGYNRVVYCKGEEESVLFDTTDVSGAVSNRTLRIIDPLALARQIPVKNLM